MKNKRIMRRILLFLFITTCFVFSTQGQDDIVFKAEAMNLVKVGEQFQVSFTINQKVSKFRPPSFDDFQYVGGPMKSGGSSIQIINGQTTKSVSYTYVYYLAAKTPGKFTIEPATITFNNEQYQSNALEIEVVGQAQPTTGGQASAQQAQPKQDNITTGDKVFVRLVVDKKNPYIGEQVTAWVKLYTKINLSGIDPQYKGPDFKGFYRNDIEVPPLRNLTREKVGDEIYHTGLLQKVVLYPQQSGELVIDPFELIVEVQTSQRRRSNSPFDDFFGPSYVTKRVTLKSKAVKFNVKPFPANKPEGFKGAVGKFTLNANLNSNSVQANDAITFTTTVSGKGNIKILEGVDYKLPPTFEAFDPVVKTKLDPGAEGRSGKKIFEITAIPRHAGDFQVDPFRLVYLDPGAGQYRIIESEPFTIHVAKGPEDTTGIVVSNLSKEDIKLLGSDINYIQTRVNLKPHGSYLFGSLKYLLWFAISFLVFISILVLQRNRIKRNADLAKVKNRKANKKARQLLKEAIRFMKLNQDNEFYEAVNKALWGYLADKLNIDLSLLSEQNAREALEKKDLQKENIDELAELIQTCEFARYAPGSEKPAKEDIISRASQILSNIDQKL